MLAYVPVEIQDVFRQEYREGVQSLWGNNTSPTLSGIFQVCTSAGAHPRTLEWYPQTQYRVQMDASPTSPASAENILRLGAIYACLLQR